MHRFLNEIGIKDDHICAPSTTDDDNGSERMELFIKEREEYGFDQRETWSLDFTAALWLYEHLKMYKEKAGEIVNLSFHRFNISEVKVDQKIWETEKISDIQDHVSTGEEKEITQEEAIDLCCDYLEHYIKTEERQEQAEKEHRNTRFASMIRETVDAYEAKQAFHIFAEILPAMWW